MSTPIVQIIIRKAVADPDFRTLLVSNPAQALESYDLSDEERTHLSNLDSSLFDGTTLDLEERLSRVYRGGWDGN